MAFCWVDVGFFFEVEILYGSVEIPENDAS